MKHIQEGLFEQLDDGSCCLLTTRCNRCDLEFYPRRTRCIKCSGDDQLADAQLTESGQLYTYSVVHQSIPAFQVPYMIGYIDFKKSGIRVFGQITGCRPEDLEIGMPLEMCIEPLGPTEQQKEKLVCKFKPVNQQQDSQGRVV